MLKNLKICLDGTTSFNDYNLLNKNNFNNSRIPIFFKAVGNSYIKSTKNIAMDNSGLGILGWQNHQPRH